MRKVKLLELCKTHRPLPTYVVDETHKQHGHSCDPVAPYQAELNSNEQIWAMLKGKVARSNLTCQEKIHISFFGACFLILYFHACVCIYVAYMNKLVFKPNLTSKRKDVKS